VAETKWAIKTDGVASFPRMTEPCLREISIGQSSWNRLNVGTLLSEDTERGRLDVSVVVGLRSSHKRIRTYHSSPTIRGRAGRSFRLISPHARSSPHTFMTITAAPSLGVSRRLPTSQSSFSLLHTSNDLVICRSGIVDECFYTFGMYSYPAWK